MPRISADDAQLTLSILEAVLQKLDDDPILKGKVERLTHRLKIKISQRNDQIEAKAVKKDRAKSTGQSIDIAVKPSTKSGRNDR